MAIKKVKQVNSAYLVCVKKREQDLETIKTQDRKSKYLGKNDSLKEEYKYLLKKERMIKETKQE